MSKAVLLIDIPTNCTECDFAGTKLCAKAFAEAFREGKVKEVRDYNKRSEWCPFGELPEYKQVLSGRDLNGVYHDDFATGWNACLNTIIGGKNADKEDIL